MFTPKQVCKQVKANVKPVCNLTNTPPGKSGRFNLKELKMKVLKFSGSWCQPCKNLTAILEKYGITNYEEVDIDTEEGMQLVAKYSIRSVPTMLKLDNEGNVLDKQIGVKPDSDIKDFFQE